MFTFLMSFVNVLYPLLTRLPERVSFLSIVVRRSGLNALMSRIISFVIVSFFIFILLVLDHGFGPSCPMPNVRVS